MILDTNAVSAFLADDPDLLTVLLPETDLHLPVIVLGEYRYGLLRSRLRAQGEASLAELERLCVVLGLDARTSAVYAQIRHELHAAGHPLPENDIWIAALARQHNLPVATRDAHFEHVKGLRRVSW